VDADLDRLSPAGRPQLPVLARLAPTVRAKDLPAQPFRDLVEANRVDQRVTPTRPGPTWSATGDCRRTRSPAGPAHRRRPPRTGSPAPTDVCTALQLIEHLQDIGEDYRAGRVYLPQQDLAEYGVAEADLAAGSASPALRASR